MFYTADQVATMATHQFAQLLWREDNHTLWLTMNRPEAKNALSPTLLRELAFAFRYAHYNPEVWSVVLAAAGDVWCAGMDLKALRNGELPNSSTIPPPEQDIVIAEMVRKMHKPLIAQVAAPVYAGGFLLLCPATYVVAAPEAKFGLPEVKRGLFPFQVMAALMEFAPTRQVIDWCIQGKVLGVAEAKALGLVTHLAEDEQGIYQLAQQLCEGLHQNSPSAIRMGLQALDEMRAVDAAAKQAYLKGLFDSIQQTADAQEGMAAFIEKRPPVWRGV